MHTPLYRAKQRDTKVGTGEQITGESEKQVQTERELWGQEVKKDAQSEASKGTGSVTLGGIEAQMKRLSEQVTCNAQEKQKRAMNQA